MRTKRHPLLVFYVIVAIFYMATNFAHPVTPTLIKRLNLEDYMFALAQNRFQFLFARAFAGIFTGAAFVSILIHVVNSVPDERQRGQCLVTVATLQGVFGPLGFFVGGMLGEINIYVSVVAQAVTLAACGVAFFCANGKGQTQVQPQPQSQKREPLSVLLREANPLHAFAQGKQFLSVAFVLLFAVCALQSLSQTAFDQTFNYYAIDQLGLSTGYNGLIKAVMGIATLVANSTLCAWLMRRTDIRRSISYVLLAATLSICAALFMADLLPFLLINVLFYALSAISIPMTQSLVASAETTADRSLVMGFYNALKSFGGIMGALLAGFTYVISPLTPFICCTIALLVATLCSVLYRGQTAKLQKGR